MEDNQTSPPDKYSIQIEKNKSISDSEHQCEDIKKESLFSIEKTRMVIVCIAAILALLSFVAFIITGDTRTLLGTSVLTYPLYRVVDFYFGRPESPKQ